VSASTLDKAKRRYEPGVRVEHWFAGKGTILKGWYHTAKDNVYVKWDKGGCGLAYRSACKII